MAADSGAGTSARAALNKLNISDDHRVHYKDIRTSGRSRNHLGHHFGDQNIIAQNVSYYGSPRQAKAEGKPRSFILPFARDKKFVGRENILRIIENALDEAPNVRRVALTGLGGVG